MTDPSSPDLPEGTTVLDQTALAELLGLLGGDSITVIAIVEAWLTEAPSLVEQLVAALDADAQFAPAHTLKSSSHTIGAMELGDLAELIESSAHGRVMDRAATAQLPVALDRAVAAVREWLADHTP